MTQTLMQFLASLQEKHNTENKIMRQAMGVKMTRIALPGILVSELRATRNTRLF